MQRIALFIVLLTTVSGLAANREADRVKESGTVLKEVLGMPDNIPAELLKKARCVLVLPSVKKLAIGVGGSYGRGVMTCRSGVRFTGGWSAPAMYALEGANIGFQLGGQATDFLILVINDRGVDSLLGSKVKLGADAAAAAGPVGRDAAAATDVVMRSEMLSYSRSRGLFAGISLEGSTLRPDGSATEKLYGRKLSAKEILREGKARIPASAALLVSTLNGATGARVARKKK
jgi:SH3 domain-containing YSC84-like protein 1